MAQNAFGRRGFLAGTAAMIASPALAQGGPTPARAAAQSLNLQPGDAELIADAISNPIEFQAIKGEREFRGELIVHAVAGKRPTAEARVANLTLRESAFVVRPLAWGSGSRDLPG